MCFSYSNESKSNLVGTKKGLYEKIGFFNFHDPTVKKF